MTYTPWRSAVARIEGALTGPWRPTNGFAGAGIQDAPGGRLRVTFHCRQDCFCRLERRVVHPPPA